MGYKSANDLCFGQSVHHSGLDFTDQPSFQTHLLKERSEMIKSPHFHLELSYTDINPIWAAGALDVLQEKKPLSL